MNVSNAKINIPKAIRSLKSKCFIDITFILCRMKANATLQHDCSMKQVYHMPYKSTKTFWWEIFVPYQIIVFDFVSSPFYGLRAVSCKLT